MNIQRRLFLKLFLAFGLTFFVISCTKTEVAAPANTYLVSGTLVKEYSKDELIKQIQTSFGQQASTLAAFVRSGIRQYKIVYKTKNTDGTEIQASGAFIIPKDLTESLPLVSMQHGTIINETDAPSYFNMATEAAIGSFFSSVGYFIVMPDYIGYGASNTLPHTYEHRAGLASASLDMIRAAREYIKDNKLNWNQSLMIGGYSEGGYANMALQKKIEEEFPTEFNLKASSSGAGAYNKTQSFKALVSQTSSGAASNNSLYLWVLLTYDRIYKLNRTMASYFVEPYATQIDKNKQNAPITVSLNTIFTDSFKNGVLNGTDAPFIAAVKDNDIYDWKPTTPTQLYHGDADELVPFLNSQTAYNAMKARGASNVTLIPIKNGTHGSSVQDYLLGTFQFFGSTK